MRDEFARLGGATRLILLGQVAALASCGGGAVSSDVTANAALQTSPTTSLSYASAVRCMWLAERFSDASDPTFAQRARDAKIAASATAYQKADAAGKSPSAVLEDLKAMLDQESTRMPPSPIECDTTTLDNSQPSLEQNQACAAARVREKPKSDAIVNAEKAEFVNNCLSNLAK